MKIKDGRNAKWVVKGRQGRLGHTMLLVASKGLRRKGKGMRRNMLEETALAYAKAGELALETIAKFLK